MDMDLMDRMDRMDFMGHIKCSECSEQCVVCSSVKCTVMQLYLVYTTYTTTTHTTASNRAWGLARQCSLWLWSRVFFLVLVFFSLEEAARPLQAVHWLTGPGQLAG